MATAFQTETTSSSAEVQPGSNPLFQLWFYRFDGAHAWNWVFARTEFYAGDRIRLEVHWVSDNPKNPKVDHIRIMTLDGMTPDQFYDDEVGYSMEAGRYLIKAQIEGERIPVAVMITVLP